MKSLNIGSLRINLRVHLQCSWRVVRCPPVEGTGHTPDNPPHYHRAGIRPDTIHSWTHRWPHEDPAGPEEEAQAQPDREGPTWSRMVHRTLTSARERPRAPHQALTQWNEDGFGTVNRRRGWYEDEVADEAEDGSRHHRGTKPHRRPFPAASSIAMGWAMARKGADTFGWLRCGTPSKCIGFRSVARSLTIGEMRAISPDGKIIGVKKAVSVDETGETRRTSWYVIFWVPSMQWSMSLNDDRWLYSPCRRQDKLGSATVGPDGRFSVLSTMEMTVLEMNENDPHWLWVRLRYCDADDACFSLATVATTSTPSPPQRIL